MTDIEKELERFISSGEATTSIDNSGFQTTHIDPLKIAKHFAQWGAAHLTNKASKIASEDLEKASEEYAYTNWESDDYHEGASEGKPFDAIGHTQKCFIDGAQWQREQMMKDAKDATIRMGRAANFIEHSWELGDYLQTFHSGQKVKVIIIKE